jgi:hypothetical protein
MATIHISHPELTAEEREKRMAAIRKAAVDLVLATEKERRK